MKEGIFHKLCSTWKSTPTIKKLSLILDIICGVGGTAGALVAGAKLSEGKGKLESLCIRTTAFGLGIAASDVASKALKESYGDIAAEVIDRAKNNAKKAKEEKAHE